MTREKWDFEESSKFWRESMPDASPGEIAALVAGDRCLSLLAQLDSLITASGDVEALCACGSSLDQALSALDPDKVTRHGGVSDASA